MISREQIDRIDKQYRDSPQVAMDKLASLRPLVMPGTVYNQPFDTADGFLKSWVRKYKDNVAHHNPGLASQDREVCNAVRDYAKRHPNEKWCTLMIDFEAHRYTLAPADEDDVDSVCLQIDRHLYDMFG